MHGPSGASAECPVGSARSFHSWWNSNIPQLSVDLSRFSVCSFLIAVGGLVAQSCPTLAASWTVPCQAPLSMGFSRQEYWSGLPFDSDLSLIVVQTNIQTQGKIFLCTAPCPHSSVPQIPSVSHLWNDLGTNNFSFPNSALHHCRSVGPTLCLGSPSWAMTQKNLPGRKPRHQAITS